MDQQRKNFNSLQDTILIVAAFAAWAWMFRAYLSGKVALFDDAISYYDHIKFYLDNWSRGVFPLWDPLWFTGAANSFFLQRMGCFNPFLMVTLVFKALGFSYLSSYLIYLMSYYFLGCLGFYFLAKEVIKDRVCSYVTFLLLLFSALGTRSFDSFMILMFTPMAWFFYFLLAFGRRQRRFAFVGVIFCLMIIVTTYIPFYFLLSVMTFLMLYVVLYFKSAARFLRNSKKFVVENKLLVVGCLLLLCLALVPGYLFFKAGGKGEYVMQVRNTNQASGSVLGVQAQDGSNSWALLEELFFAWHYYMDIRLIKFAVIYIPLFAGIVVLLGAATRINRSVLLLFLWLALLLLICIPKASPIYSFLYQHVIVFKYFRNLHFYLWVTILPAFCMFLGLQLKNYLDWRPSNLWEKILGVVHIAAVHGLAIVLLSHFQFPIVSSYIVVILSCLLFLVRLFTDVQRKMVFFMACFLLIAMIEPFEVYNNLSRNTRPYQPDTYLYNWTSLDFHYVRGGNDVEIVAGTTPDNSDKQADGSVGRVVRPLGAFYYASKWFSYLSANVDMYVIKKYLTYKFVIYDSVAVLNDDAKDFSELETAMAENRNVAYVATDDPGELKHKPAGNVSYYARQIHGPADDFYVEKFTANHIKIKTRFAKPQFVVYNDNDHSQWRLWVNGVPRPIVRSNLAFKGVWVEPGEQTLDFRFGSNFTWMIYLVLLVGINGVFIVILFLRWRESATDKSELILQGNT
ncbi:MAG: hypothetical protein JNN05_04215 [Candidatus Omnitrophica bacterium]|nr:hypothetical protein [Candidatus Omnitrophota bacterium]